MIEEEGKCRAEAEARGLPEDKSEKEQEKGRRGGSEQKKMEGRPEVGKKHNTVRLRSF